MKQNLSQLMESELEKSELILAAKGIADELQSMAEKTAKLSVDELMPLVDRLKEIFGQEQAEQFNNSVDGTLSTLLDQLKSSKDEVENQANILNGEGDMGINSDMDFNSDPGMGGLEMGDPEFDGMGDTLDGMGDEDEGDIFGADDTMVGGSEPLGRAKKESYKIKGKNLKEMAKRIQSIEKKLKRLKTKA